MKHRVYRAYVNFIKEEKWLNQMEQKGFHLVDYTFCRYLFEEGTPGEYIYRLELLRFMPAHPESAAYLRFMEDNGVECVATYLRWAFLRKKASEGNFEIYSDLEGKMMHIKRVTAFLILPFMLNLFAVLINLTDGLLEAGKGWSFNASLVPINLFVAVGILTVMVSYIRTMRQLKKEKMIRE